MDQIHHLLRHQHHPQPPNDVVSGDRLPQWSVQETKEFLAIRAELDQNFMETKRNKQLWEVISNAMKDKGYLRSSEQCKCKWKNLVTRYKGCETVGPENARQKFPFYIELQAILIARMQRLLWTEAEGEGGGRGSKKEAMTNLSSEDEDENENEEMSIEGERSRKRMKKGKMIGNNSSSGGTKKTNLKEILEEFLRQQMQIEAQWMEAFEARESERRMKEMEWRQTMEALESERMMMFQRWREREEERRMREEAGAEKRDALITALLNKLTREEMQ